MSIESVIPSNHLILCCPLLLPSIFLSIKVFSNKSTLHIRWPKYWSFSISPSNGYSELISFRIDWFDLLAVPWTLKSLLQHHKSLAGLPIKWRWCYLVSWLLQRASWNIKWERSWWWESCLGGGPCWVIPKSFPTHKILGFCSSRCKSALKMLRSLKCDTRVILFIINAPCGLLMADVLPLSADGPTLRCTSWLSGQGSLSDPLTSLKN